MSADELRQLKKAEYDAQSAEDQIRQDESLISNLRDQPNHIERIAAEQRLADEKQKAAKMRADAAQMRESLKSTYGDDAAISQAEQNLPWEQYELERQAGNLFGGSYRNDVQSDHEYVPSTDRQKYNLLKLYAEQNPEASISEIVRMYQSSPLQQGNVTIDYEATLQARQQGLNVGEAIYGGLPETFQKDWDKKFGEHNKIINLYEGGQPTPASEAVKPAFGGKASSGYDPITGTLTPQNPRKKAADQGNASKLINEQLEKNKAINKRQAGTVINEKGEAVENPLYNTNYTISLTEGAPVLGDQPKQLAVSLSEGKPPVPKQYTQEQVNKLTPTQYATYKADIEAYNKFTKEKNMQTKKENLAEWQKNKKDMLGFITEAKKEGAQFISIKTDTENKTVPINNAFLEIVKSKNVKGISTVPNIPEGFTVGGTLAAPVLVQDQGQKIGPEQAYSGSNKNPPKGKDALTFALTEQKPQSWEQNLKDVGEGLAVGFVRTSALLTRTFPLAFTEIVRTGNPLEGEKVLSEHEEIFSRIGPSAPVAVMSGSGTGRSPYYNVAETVGEFGIGAIGIEKGLKIRNPFAKSIATTPKVMNEPFVVSGRVYKPTNMMRQGIPKDVFAGDTATPFQGERISLGRGQTIQPKGYEPAQKIAEKPAVKADVNYKPELPKVRAAEKGTYRIDQKNIFKSDTASAKFVGQKVELGAGTTKRITPAFETKRIELGEGKIIFRKEPIDLGRGIVSNVARVEDQISPKSIATDPYYQPNLPKTRAKEKGTYRIQQEKIFQSDKKLAGFEETKAGLGRGMGRLVSSGEDLAQQGKRPPVKPKPEPETKSGKQVLIQKKAESAFKTTRVALGESKGTVIATGGMAVAPIPLLITAEEQEPVPDLTNGTGTNQTLTSGMGVIIEPEPQSTPSILEPASISERRATFAGAIAGTDLAFVEATRVRERAGLIPRVSFESATKQKEAQKSKPTLALQFSQPQAFKQSTKQAQRFAFGSPEPERAASLLAQPQKFKQKPLEKLTQPPRKPPRSSMFIPVPEFEKKTEKKKKEEEKESIEFIGNAPQENVVGLYKKFDIKYGAKRVSKQSALDISTTRKAAGYTRFVNSGTSSHLEKSKQGILKARAKPKNAWRKF